MFVRGVFISISLMVLWLLMSGIYQPLIIGFGVLSSALCVWIIHRLGLLGKEGILSDLSFVRLVKYLFWLTVEIGKADWAVAKIILSPKLPKDQRLLRIKATQKSDFAKMIYANSITITPGTVTVETEPDTFIVHALTAEAADKDALLEMCHRVSALEHDGGALR